MTAEPEARQGIDFPRGIVREVSPLSLWGGDTLIYRSILSLAGIALPVVAGVHWAVKGELPFPQIGFLVVVIAGASGCLALARRGNREVAGALLIGLLWIATTVYAFKTGYGMHSALVFVYVPCLLYSALFFGIVVACAELALTAGALALMYFAETSGRLEGAAGLIATGTSFNYFLGIVLTLVATLAAGAIYHRRVEREAARVVGEAARHFAALKAAQEARAQLETAHARLASAGLALDVRAVERDREVARLRRVLDLLRPSLPAALGEVAAWVLRPVLRETLDLTSLATHAAARARALPGCGRVFVRVDSGLRATGDRAMVEALLDRLLARACQACRGEPEPAVYVGGGSLEGQQVYFVRDNGPALDAARRDEMFRPMAQGAPDFSLVQARCIVECHGGEIEVDAGQGNETTLFFSLPA